IYFLNRGARPSDVPVVASYCATFLKPEMLHIYRQITSLRRVRPVVIAQKRENADRFPFQNIRVVKKPALHFLRRTWFKQIADRPWQISPAEVRATERALTESNAELLHIYFGHIAMLLRRLIEKKGLKTTLRAFARFQKEFPAARLTIAGEGPQLEELQSLARELQIDGAVDFVGFVSQEELRELLYSSHIFLHPSETGRD